MSNLVAVYFLEYMITTSFVVAITRLLIEEDPSNSDDFIFVNAFVIFNMCYQLGVFVSRSSLACF